jgi:hypothetical protein
MMMRFVIAVAVAALAGCGTGSSSRTTAENRCDAEARALRPTDADVRKVAKHLVGVQASPEDIYGVAWLNVIADHYTQCMAAAGYSLEGAK